MASKMSERLNFKSVEELLGVVNEEAAMDIEIYKISGFKGHPFKVIDDEKMQELVESIKVNGVLSPVLIRPTGMDTYEMISGHRRLHAAQLAGLTAIPSIIREMTDDEAVITMVDANIQREELLPSEKAFAVKMKMEAVRRQGNRSDLTSDQNGPKLSAVEVGESAGISSTQVKRYIRLTELIPEILDLVDQKKVQFTLAVDISYFDEQVQKWIYEYIKDNGFLKPVQIAALKEQANLSNASQYNVISILNGALPQKSSSAKVSLSEKKLDKYFPPHYSAKQREEVIIQLLEQWSKEQAE